MKISYANHEFGGEKKEAKREKMKVRGGMDMRKNDKERR